MSTPPTPEPPEPPAGQEPSAGPAQPAGSPDPAEPAGQEPPPAGSPVAVARPQASAEDARNLGVLTWLLGLFFSIIGPLIIWLIKRDESPFVDSVGKTVLNFNISYTIWIIVTAILSVVLIGIPFLIAAATMYLVFSIIGAVKASQGEYFVPWLTIPFLR